MLENFFLIYANNSFRENPKNVHKIFDEIYPCLDFNILPDFKKDKLDILAKQMVTFAKCNDPILAKERQKELISKHPPLYRKTMGYLYDVAYEAIYRYRDSHCPDQCALHYGDGLTKNAENLDYGGTRRLKCIECKQIFFVELLTKLVGGESFENLMYPETIDQSMYDVLMGSAIIPDSGIKIGEKISGGFGFGTYIEKAFKCVKEEIEFTSEGKFQKKSYIDSSHLISDISQYPVDVRFDDFITSLVGYSLTNLLLNNERTKLKQCRKCDKFFIASKNDDRIKYCPECSQKSKMSKAEKAEYMRQYRQRKRQERIAQRREARIENLIQRAGYSREEAEKVIEADAMM